MAFIRGPAQFRLRRGRCEATISRIRAEMEGSQGQKNRSLDSQRAFAGRSTRFSGGQSTADDGITVRAALGVRHASPFSPSFQIYHGLAHPEAVSLAELKAGYRRSSSAKSCKPQADHAWACIRSVLLLPFSVGRYLRRAPPWPDLNTSARPTTLTATLHAYPDGSLHQLRPAMRSARSRPPDLDCVRGCGRADS